MTYNAMSQTRHEQRLHSLQWIDKYRKSLQYQPCARYKQIYQKLGGVGLGIYASIYIFFLKYFLIEMKTLYVSQQVVLIQY